ASIVVAVVLGIGTTLLAAWLPAARAVRLDIATTIRERENEGVPISSVGWMLPFGFALGAIAATLVQSWSQSPTLGLLATALVVAAIASGSPAIIQLAAAIAQPILVCVFGSSGRLAAKGLR